MCFLYVTVYASSFEYASSYELKTWSVLPVSFEVDMCVKFGGGRTDFELTAPHGEGCAGCWEICFRSQPFVV